MQVAIFNGIGRIELSERSFRNPADNEVSLKIRRVGICGTDVLISRGGMAQRVAPGRILGHEMVAEVAQSTADGIFKTGDRVVVEPTVACHGCQACRRGLTHVCEHLRFLGIDQDGALQEFWNVPADRLHRVTDSLTDDLAAMVEPLAVAVHGIRMASLRAEERVAIIGGGPIGLMIALLARKVGARVILFEINPFRLKFARQFDLKAFDPTDQSPIEIVHAFTDAAGADVVFEASGSASGARMMTSLAGVHGRLMVVGIQNREATMDLFQVFYRELTIQGARAYSSGDFTEAIRLLASSEIDLSQFVTHRYAFQNVSAAFDLASSGTDVMKVLVDFNLQKKAGPSENSSR
jgi:2-desacetyl-2-hydroxyethyl bacteriochlorophyllide A dehydrogenase